MNMSDTIFTVELPVVESNSELAKVKAVYSKYDPYFIASGCFAERREMFDKLWKNYKPYADRHFLDEIRTNFHQRSWEMYVGNVLLEKQLPLYSKNEGPDFVIRGIAYVECVAPTKGDPTKLDSVPKMLVAESIEDMSVQEVPDDKMIMRITQVIKDKALNQFENWKNKNWFDPNMPFVIAVNTGDLDYVEESSMPNVLKALFGFDELQVNLRNRNTSYSTRHSVIKENGKFIPVDYFIREDFSFISGVIFSSKSVLNHPESIGEDCFFVNNPYASNKLDKSFVNLFKNWIASKEDNIISLKRNY